MIAGVVVRPLDGARDMPGMLALADAELRSPGCKIIPHDLEFYGRYRGSAGETLVATHDEAIIGLILLAAPERLHPIWHDRAGALGLDPARCGCLVQVILAPTFRGRGLSQPLIEGLVACARERGIEQLFTSVDPDNPASMQTMVRGGFRCFEVATVYSEQVVRALFHRTL